MKPEQSNQLNSDETEQLNREIAPVEILFGATLISILLVFMVLVLIFIYSF